MHKAKEILKSQYLFYYVFLLKKRRKKTVKIRISYINLEQ
jgi:hypothetical protein